MDTEAVYRELVHGPGYARLPGVIDADEAQRVRGAILARLETGNREPNGGVRLPNLLTADALFTRLATHPTILSVAHRMVGEDCRLAAFGGNVLMPGCEPGGLHVDYPYWAMDPGMPVEPALMLQVIWMMEPFDERNGGTWVAPGSQAWERYPDTATFEQAAVQVSGGAGDAILSHGLLWHRTAVNRSDAPRVALLINYAQLAIRPMTELGPFSEAFRADASAALRSLLGFDHARALRDRVRRVTSGGAPANGAR